MSEEKRVEKSTDDRVDLLIQMLDLANKQPNGFPLGPSEFAFEAIAALKTKFPESSSFYANAERMRSVSQLESKNHFVDPFVVATHIGFAYAFAIVREWESMTGKPAIETISEGPTDDTCQG